MPAWLALIVHVPAPTSVTVLPLRLQMPALAAARVKVTARPELAVAVTVYDDPPTTAPAGGVDVKVIVCTLWDGAGLVTANDCCACGAA